MKEGDVVIVKRVCVSEKCEECGERATKKITFLYENARRNPASSAYGKDDCSWCEDEKSFACEVHDEKIRRNPPRDMVWCSTFSRDRFEHMFLRWKETKEEVAI